MINNLLTAALTTILTAALTFSCGSKKRDDSSDRYQPGPDHRLVAAYQAALLDLKAVSESGGWPAAEECDGALWMGMAVRAGNDTIDATASIQPDGRPTRLYKKDCMPGNTGSQVVCVFDAPCMGGSASTISNDMITGILLALIHNKDAEAIDRMYQYGERNSWFMGYPVSMVGRVYLRPNGRTIMARALYKLTSGQIDYSMYRILPVVYSPFADDYEIQLQALGLLIAKDLEYFGMTEQAIANELAERNPNDALVQAVAGNYTRATELLLDPGYVYPSYVRGHPNYNKVHFLLASKLIIEGMTK